MHAPEINRSIYAILRRLKQPRMAAPSHACDGNVLNLAIFDLDHTLLDGDSDYLWGSYIASRGALDAAHYEAENQRFYEQYKAGTLDIRAFARFSLRPLRENDPERLHTWRHEFIEQVIEPIILPAARELISRHRERGDELLIITATNSFITAPIASALGVPHLLATDPEMIDGRYTGEISGTPTFQGGKVERLNRWLETDRRTFERIFFYSDSHNDLPLLQRADVAVAVDPDPELLRAAEAHGWPIVSLKHQSGDAVFERVGGR